MQDYIWCWALDDCLNSVVKDIESRGLKVGRWFTYANEEKYEDEVMLKCEMDKKINSSRVYHRMVVPQKYDPNWDCTFKKGETVDIIFTIFTGTDPHSLLVDAADNLGMEVYLPMPSIPDTLDQRGAFYEFTKRVLKHYSVAYAGKKSYKGVYQTNEAWLGVSDLSQVCLANEILSGMTHSLGKLYVISPYIGKNNSIAIITTTNNNNNNNISKRHMSLTDACLLVLLCLLIFYLIKIFLLSKQT